MEDAVRLLLKVKPIDAKDYEVKHQANGIEHLEKLLENTIPGEYLNLLSTLHERERRETNVRLSQLVLFASAKRVSPKKIGDWFRKGKLPRSHDIPESMRSLFSIAKRVVKTKDAIEKVERELRVAASNQRVKESTKQSKAKRLSTSEDSLDRDRQEFLDLLNRIHGAMGSIER